MTSCAILRESIHAHKRAILLWIINIIENITKKEEEEEKEH